MEIPPEELKFQLSPRACSGCKRRLPLDEFIGICLGSCFGKFHFSCIPFLCDEKSDYVKAIDKGNIRVLCPPCEKTRFDPASYLPPEIMTMVFTYLGVKDLASCSLVCHQWRALSGSDIVWRKKCLENNILGNGRVSPEDESILPPLGQKALYYRESMKRFLNNLLKNHSREHIFAAVILRWSFDGRILLMDTEDEGGIAIYDLGYDHPEKIQVLKIDSTSYRSVKVMCQMIVFLTNTGFTLYRRSDIYHPVISWNHPPDTLIKNGYEPDRVPLLNVLTTESYLYCQTKVEGCLEELYIWCLATDTLFRRVVLSRFTRVLWSPRNLCLVDGSHSSDSKRVMVLYGHKALTIEYDYRVEGFSSSKIYTAFYFNNSFIHVYDIEGVLHFKYKWDFVRGLSVLNDGGVVFNCACELVYISPRGVYHRMEHSSKGHDSKIFCGKYVWSSSHFTISLYNLSGGILIHKLRKGWKWGNCTLSADILVMEYNTKRDFSILTHLKMLSFRDIGF